MGVISIRIPEDVYERYKSLSNEERRKYYNIIQGFITALLKGDVNDPNKSVFNINVNVGCRDRGGVKEVERLFIYVTEALKIVRKVLLSDVRLPQLIKELRNAFVAIALNTTKDVEKYVRGIQKSYSKLIDMYINNNEDKEEIRKTLEEIEKELFQLHNYLSRKYPVF